MQSGGGQPWREPKEEAKAHKALSEGFDLEGTPLLHGLLPQPSNRQAIACDTSSDTSQTAVQWESGVPPGRPFNLDEPYYHLNDKDTE